MQHDPGIRQNEEQESEVLGSELIIPGVSEGEFEAADSDDFEVPEDSRYSDVVNRITREENEGDEISPVQCVGVEQLEIWREKLKKWRL